MNGLKFLEFFRKWDRTIVLIFSFIVAGIITYNTIKDTAKKSVEHGVKIEKVEKFVEVQKEINQTIKEGMVEIQRDIKTILRNSR